MTAEDIKAKFPLRVVAGILGIDLPGDGQKFRSPFREDKNPSCTIKGEFFRDWSDDKPLDSIGFFAAAKGISNSDAVRQLRVLAGGHAYSPGGKVRVSAPSSKPKTKPKNPPQAVTKPEIKEPILEPTRKLIERTAGSRNLSPEAFETARVVFGTLGYARLFEKSCWYLTDRLAPGWEARRCDGQEFEPCGSLGPRKSHSKGAGLKSWPVGIAPPKFSDEEIERLDPLILVVEGGPDYIAAIELCWLKPLKPCLPCAMLGKSADISEQALPRFSGRRVAIVGHDDAEKRILEWANQIRKAGAKSVRPIKLGSRDLNDIARDYPGELQNLSEAIGLINP